MAGNSGEQRSFWAANVEHTVQIMRAELSGNLVNEFRILKVRESQRIPTSEYTPKECRFGLHNRDESLNMSDSEVAKRALLVLFELDEDSKWTRFYNDVVPDSREMLKCYGLHREVNDSLEAEIKQVLALDALFLAYQIEGFMGWDSRILVTCQRWQQDRQRFLYFEDTFPSNSSLGHDLNKIENQIPFVLVKRVINHVSQLTNPGQVPHAEYLNRWLIKAVRVGLDVFMKTSDEFYSDATLALSRSHHVLDASYKVICGVDGMERVSHHSKEDYIHVPSATVLKESGIKIEGVVGPLSAMLYDKKKKCLFMPKTKLHDDTGSMIRNMARYEEYSKGSKCMFHDYVVLMLDLIQTPLDMNHLVNCGVIYNGCGEKGVDLWRGLGELLYFICSSKEHNKMKADINDRCTLRRYRLWSEFKTLFLSKPWLTLSAIAITLVTLATLIQTYATVIGSDGMKPRFKP